MENSNEEPKDVINIQELKNKLERGHLTKIADKLEVTPQCISNQFSKKSKIKKIKPEVVKAALEVLADEKKLKDELNEQIKSA